MKPGEEPVPSHPPFRPSENQKLMAVEEVFLQEPQDLSDNASNDKSRVEVKPSMPF
jgi:hypothetical protein